MTETTALRGDGEAREPFGYLRFDGGRFRGRLGMPVASASELDRYARLVTVVAHHLFREDHPQRTRGFKKLDDSFDLRLAGVDEGSVIPVLTRAPLDTHTLFSVDTDYHSEARRLINDALSKGANGYELPNSFPAFAVQDLANLGRGLRGDERMEFSDSKEAPIAATVNRASRQNIQRLANLDKIATEVPLVGRINGLTSDPQKCEFRREGKRRKVVAEYVDPSTFELLYPFLGQRENAPLVELVVVETTDRAGKHKQYTDVITVEPSLPLEWRARLEEVASVEEGWLYPASPPPSPDVMAAVRDILLAGMDADIARPGMFPSAEGGVQLEWTGGPRTLEVVVLNDRSVHAMWSTDGDEEGERPFTDSDPYQVAEYIAEVLRGGE